MAPCWCTGLALVALLGGCANVPERRVVQLRVDDQLYGAEAPLAGSTFWYPRREVGAETRAVLRAADLRQIEGQGPVRLELEVPPGGVLEFGYALGAVSPGATVEFSVAAVTPAGPVQLFDAQLQAHSAQKDSTPAPGDGWHEARVALGSLSGRVRLEFLAASDRAAEVPSTDGVPACGFFSAPVVTVPSRTPAPVNVILISLDTLRADRLGIYGYGRNTSPNIDRIFGAGGVVVERLYANAATTLPGHAAMLTGLEPMTALRPGRVGKLERWETTLAESFRAYGYRTAAFTEDAWVTADLGFWRGFERFSEIRGTEGAADTAGHSKQILAEGLRWLDQYRGQPTFLFLHTYEVHYPYTPHGVFVPEDGSERAVDSANYDGEIHYLDEQLGNFLTALEERGILDDTIVVVTADHGEEFGEHGRRYHGTNLHDEILRVPALFLARGRLPAGVRRSGPVAQVDLMPTILDLAGIAIPPDLDGLSFASHLRGGGGVAPREVYHEATSRLVMGYGTPITDWIAPSYGMTKWPYRLLRIRTKEGARYELYDLADDPGETKNLFSSLQQRFVEERAALDGYEQASAARREELTRRIGSAGTTGAPPPGEVPPAVREKLRALGYLD